MTSKNAVEYEPDRVVLRSFVDWIVNAVAGAIGE